MDYLYQVVSLLSDVQYDRLYLLYFTLQYIFLFKWLCCYYELCPILIQKEQITVFYTINFAHQKYNKYSKSKRTDKVPPVILQITFKAANPL